MIYLFTGQPGSGKTTLAKWLKEAFSKSQPIDSDRQFFLVDGDDMRRISNNKDYSDAGRKRNIGEAFAIAKYLDEYDNYDVIVSMVSPFKELRDELKSIANVVEIYVHTQDIRGREQFHVANYEPPTENFIEIDTTDVGEMTSLNELLNKLIEQNAIPRNTILN